MFKKHIFATQTHGFIADFTFLVLLSFLLFLNIVGTTEMI